MADTRKEVLNNQFSNQEQIDKLFNYHRKNLEKGALTNPDGSVTTFKSVRMDTPTGVRLFPSYLNGQVYSPQEAYKIAEQQGLYVDYPDGKQAEKADNTLHKRIEADTQTFRQRK